MLSTVANAKETKILYYQYQIPFFLGGTQVAKFWYVKESIKKVNSNPNIIQVKTYSTVTIPKGITKYRVTLQINCKTRKFTRIKYWSSGFGDDDGLMVNGRWEPVIDYDDMIRLADEICP